MTKSKKPQVEQPISIRKPDWRCREGHLPTRVFSVGEKVEYGNHPNCEILEVLNESAQYNVRVYGVKKVFGVDTEYSEVQYGVHWYQLQKLGSVKKTNFTKPRAYRLHVSSRTVGGLISQVHGDHAGVDFSPEYQRDYVWNLTDKEKLIDSIFNHVSIGLFVFAKRPFAEGEKNYEIIDGKQRLTALVEFFEDRFTYRGFYFSELSPADKCQFEDYPVSFGIVEEPTEKEKYATFLAVNTFGKVMDENHLEKVREYYEAL